ncbi:crossover junction endodeoxyribonuclease RuvC [candidate division KSB1 bacterium]|nr:crossover junction endodeoxyribonuclease RuvC [candidate division KSB1 bacterium]NIR70262.1 crossover junction endodeoxyribonuclease RuvC [candidate division KSB1 bacterium]NIS26533.1 crossover junction endodeoxyribonuclease RuvC [candidate division KSB1 bacterium]NIT73295.1 crossover junction endodeoxyribonuclease RuvC [candidate division KSB1 bacterium]NIU23919.1 crossover junction endodeoxyribonuclease RuvC [candidate division KSB1 bacterium]
MRILGVDPGTVVMGFGIVESSSNGCTSLDFGCLRLSSKEGFPTRLKKIYDQLSSVIVQYQPDEFAIEDLFYAQNVKSALNMGHARGVAILAAVNYQIPTSEYSPREIKQAVVGNGAASKEQVQSMVQRMLSLPHLPEPLDASDALAVALCHVHRMEARL